MPVHKGRLKEADYTKIQMNFIFLKRELDGNYLLDEMFAANVFTMDDKQEIQSEHSREKRTDMFLEKLLHSGPKAAYGVFLRALEIHYPHVAQSLEKDVSEEVEEHNKDNHKDEGSSASQGGDELPGTEVRIRGCKLKESFILCEKSPGHESFIPINSFDISHLPLNFQQPEVVEYVKVLGEQTVKAQRDNVSRDRPEGFPFHGSSVDDRLITGTGRVWRVMRNFSETDNDTCPCDACKHSSSPVRQWGEFIVVTAQSFVFGEEECVNSQFILWYDDGHYLDSDVLTGVGMLSSNIFYDYCEVLCVTHDKVVSEKLEAICKKNEDLSTKLARTCYKRKNPEEKLTIIISHPHGFDKQVTVGEWVEGDNDWSGGPNNHVYTTATCPGSAGAPVLLLDNRMSCCTTHSRGRRGNSNESGGKLWPL